MRKFILILGLSVLVIGLVLAASIPEVEKPYIKTYTNFEPLAAGKYVSFEINISAETEISTLGSGAYLVTASSVGIVTESNIMHYNLPMTLNLTVNGVPTHSYVVQTGSYYVVYFGSDSASVSYTIINHYSLVSLLGTMYVVGLGLILAGIVLTGLGAILKPKSKQ